MTQIEGKGPDGYPRIIRTDADGRMLQSADGWFASPSTPASSSAYEAGIVLKASSGTFRSCYIQLDPALATATYYAQLLIAASVPPDGAVTFLRPPYAISHTNGSPSEFEFNEGDSGIEFATGCVACVSSTQFTKTEVAAAALFAGSVL